MPMCIAYCRFFRDFEISRIYFVQISPLSLHQHFHLPGLLSFTMLTHGRCLFWAHHETTSIKDIKTLRVHCRTPYELGWKTWETWGISAEHFYFSAVLFSALSKTTKKKNPPQTNGNAAQKGPSLACGFCLVQGQDHMCITACVCVQLSVSLWLTAITVSMKKQT